MECCCGEEGAEWGCEVSDEAVLEEMNESSDTRVVVAESGKDTVMRSVSRAVGTHGTQWSLADAAVSARLGMSQDVPEEEEAGAAEWRSCFVAYATRVGKKCVFEDVEKLFEGAKRHTSIYRRAYFA